ncbi:MAG: hypothetical protein D3923_06690, partial [Candidatus Electrothrix sp. AR3]|nr:hypothetical protein [Candidatus Electrothrix sp. AR3]
MQAQRFWIERSFQDAKNQCGMSDYQSRSWRSWHHHEDPLALDILEGRFNEGDRVVIDRGKNRLVFGE